jgi:hypothetical protein
MGVTAARARWGSADGREKIFHSIDAIDDLTKTIQGMGLGAPVTASQRRLRNSGRIDGLRAETDSRSDSGTASGPSRFATSGAFGELGWVRPWGGAAMRRRANARLQFQG